MLKIPPPGQMTIRTALQLSIQMWWLHAEKYAGRDDQCGYKATLEIIDLLESSAAMDLAIDLESARRQLPDDTVLDLARSIWAELVYNTDSEAEAVAVLARLIDRERGVKGTQDALL